MKLFLRIFFTILLIANSAYSSNQFKHGISIFGDLKYQKNFRHFDYVNPQAPKKGSFKFGVEGTFNSLNPFILKGISASGLSYVYESLMEGSDDEISSYYGLIAESVKLSDDKYSIEFKIRKEARWHDGSKITADDVIFTFNKLISDGHPSYKMIYREVKNVEKVASDHVKFYFKTNQNRDLPLIVASMTVLPKHFFEKVDFNKTTLEPILGSGPYKIKKVDIGKSITFTRNKDYWGENLPVNKGRYNFDEITFDYYRDNNVLVEAFKAQKYDFRQESISRNWSNSYNIEAVKNGQIIKKEIPNSLPSSIQTFVLNLRKEKFQSLELRKALTYAFDFEWLKNHIFYNSYKRTQSYFANSNFAYKNFSMPVSESDGYNRKNLIKAKEVLDQAGYKVIEQKLIDPKTNKQLEIEFLIDSSSFQMVIATFVKNLERLGIKGKIRLVEENQYQTRVNNFDYDVIVAVFSQSMTPGNELFSYWHSSQVDIKGGRNFSGLNDRRIDDLVIKIGKTKNKSELTKLCQEFDKIMLENYYTILQWHNNTYRILYRNIFAMPKITPQYSLSIDSWWIND